ncbi:MAG: hypothetical protein KAH77_06040 [Thiomargarita sp.]|nr:hypothetical protein [Thiomargarita sp.]
MPYVVKNLFNTKDYKCSCQGGWLGHWRTGAGSQRETCSVAKCSNEATVGAHVIFIDKRRSKEWWIAPFCHTCNHPNMTGPITLNRRITLVSANKSKSCEGSGNWKIIV